MLGRLRGYESRIGSFRIAAWRQGLSVKYKALGEEKDLAPRRKKVKCAQASRKLPRASWIEPSPPYPWGG
jgi:hypothetical protein